MATDTDRLLLMLDADVTRLSKQMAKATGDTTKELKKIEKAAEGSMVRLETLFGKTHVGEALENVFKRTRLTVLEEGSAKIPIFGSALEALGPAGLAGAAGVAAVAMAMEQAKAAAEYSEEISNTADKLGLTTKALQEYHFAALAGGVSTQAMDEALESGNERLGEFQSNIGSARVKKVFEALGITQEEASKARTIVDLIPQIAAKMQGLSAAEQTAVAKRAGLEGVINVLRKGPEAIADLRTEAERSGAVLDSDLLAKGKAAAEAMRETSQVVSVNLHRAFVDLAPVIEACVRLVASMARDLADAVEAIGGVAHMSRTGVMDGIGETDRAMGNWGAAARFGGAKLNQKTGLMEGGGLSGAMGAVGMYNFFKGQRDRENARLKELDGMDAADAVKASRGSSGQLVADKAKKQPHDDTQANGDAAASAYAQSLKEAASATAALVKDIAAHAELEKQAVDDDTTKKLIELDKQEETIRKTTSKARQAEQIALVEKAKTETQNAAAAKKELIDREASASILAKNIDLQKSINAALSHVAEVRASLSLSTSGRNAISTKNLLDNQQRERIDFDADANEQLRDNAKLPDAQQDHGLAGELDQRRQALLASQAADRDALAQQQQSPWQQWMQEGEKAGNDVGQVLQSEAVKGMDDLNNAIAESIVQGKNLGQIMHSIFQSMEADVIRYLARQAEVGIFGGGGLASGLFGSSAPQASAAAAGTNSGLLGSLIAMLPHFAAGTDDAPGGLSLVGEKGPELVNLPGGAGVTPNNALRSLSAMDPSKMRGSTSNQTVQFDMRGAVMTEDLLRQANAYAEQVGRGAFAASVGVARQVIPGDLRRRSAASFIS